MVVTAVVDTPAVLLLDALDAVRTQPAPAGQVPSRLAALSHAQAQLRGVYLRELAAAEAAGEPAAHGCRSAADLLVDTAGLPAWQARKDAAFARRLALVPGLLDALAEGGLELDAALLLVRAWSALPPALRDAATAEALVLLAGLVDLADLKAKVDELVGALQPEVTDESVAAARESGGLVLTDVGAETRLSGTTDVLTGEWLREVLEAKAEADRGLQDGRDGDARLLDALLDIVRAGIGTGAVPGGSTADGGAPLLVVVATPDDLVAAADAATGPAPVRVDPADALDELLAPVTPDPPASDVPVTPDPPASDGPTDDRSSGVPASTWTGARRWSARSRGGHAVGPRTLLGLCCGALLSRLLLDPAGHPVDSTPAARQLNRRDRRALEHRAGYRCERQGCGRPARNCVPHHVDPFALGGLSVLANTVLLCRSCHHLLHDRAQRLFLTGERVIGPVGWVSGGPPGS